MIYSIENDKLKIEVDSLGGQLMSVKSRKTGVEYLWQGDPKYWHGRAYNLFPVIGRLIDGKYTYKGNTYELGLHGFIRKNELYLDEKTATKISFIYKDNEETRKQYPFKFIYRLEFTLDDNRLKVSYKATNTGSDELICGFGGHPGFNVPFDGGNFEDYYLDFNKKTDVKRNTLSPRYFMTGDKIDFPLVDGKILPLVHGLFDDDAVVLENTSNVVSIRGKNTKRSVTMEYEDFKYIGFWHAVKTDAPYVCLEPWSALPSTDGITDDFETKKDMTHIEPDKTKGVSYTIVIDE